MKQSKLFFKTRKEVPSDADSINASYLIRASFIDKHMAGVYAFLPLGLRVIKKIENIIREEMNAVGGQEMLMNGSQPQELWKKTGRWDEMDEVLFKSGEGKDRIAFAATHEEQVTWIVKNRITSYKELPLSLYQIQTKYRNEPRAKSGLLRGREFLMKDMYSFHTSDEDFEKYYDLVKKAYLKAYKRMGLEAKIVEASGGAFTKKNSHEFQILTPVGEDQIFYCDKCDFAQNKEIATVSEGDKCPVCDGKIGSDRGIEVGNIFPLETKYSSKLEAQFTDSDGKLRDIVMGSYGIGISRAMGTVVEVHYDGAKNRMIWPEEISPFNIHLLSLNQNEAAEKLYDQLVEAGVSVLFDDREISAGEKFAEADLVGIPKRIIVSHKSLEQGGAEYIDLKKDLSEIKSFPNIVSVF